MTARTFSDKFPKRKKDVYLNPTNRTICLNIKEIDKTIVLQSYFIKMLFYNFKYWDEGFLIGEVSSEVIEQMRKSN